MGIWDYVILAAVAPLVGLAVFVLVKRKKAGKGSCGDCEHCPGCAARKETESKTE